MASEREILESIVTLVEALLPLPILEQHKRDVISGMLWKLTEARGKFNTRYRSAAACAAVHGTPLQHEHVFTRKDITDQILANPASARRLLESALACVVTKDEHMLLTSVTRKNPGLKGWERYRTAGIEVVDTDHKG